MPAKLSRNIKALGWVSFLTDVNSESILPLLPLFVTQVLGLDRLYLGLIEGIAESTASLLKIVSGWFSDKIRRRKNVTAAGYVLSTIVKPVLAFSRTGFLVLLVRFFDKVGKGVRTAPRDALVAESIASDSLGHAYGFHRMMDTSGAVMGSLIAYVLLNALVGTEGYRMRLIFLLSSVFGVAAVVILLVFVREMRPAVQTKILEVEVDAPSSKNRKRLWGFFGVNTVFYLSMFSYAFFLLRAQSLGLPTEEIPLIYLFYNVVYALVSMPMGNLSDSVGRKPVILIAYSSYALLCLAFAFATSKWHAWALFALYGVHSATVDPASRALVAGLSKVESRGTALGFYHASVGIAALPASLIAGSLWDWFGARMPFLVAGILALLATVLMLMLSLEDRQSEG